MCCLVAGRGASSRIPVGAGSAAGACQCSCMEALVHLEMGRLVFWHNNLDGRAICDRLQLGGLLTSFHSLGRRKPDRLSSRRSMLPNSTSLLRSVRRSGGRTRKKRRRAEPAHTGFRPSPFQTARAISSGTGTARCSESSRTPAAPPEVRPASSCTCRSS